MINDTNETRYFITLVHKPTARVIMNLVMADIKKGESFNKVAKELRKEVCKYSIHYSLPNNVKPSDIEWAIYTRRVADENDEMYFEGVKVYELLTSSNEKYFSQVVDTD